MEIVVYLDWNVFNKIEKKETLESGERDAYNKIEELVIQDRIITPYSNAHINDLLRGYQKSKEYTPAHINTLRRLTNNLCLTQYWGHNKVTWHYREVQEFFDSSLDDLSFTHKRFTELIDLDGIGSTVMSLQYSILKMISLPSNFGEIYKADPIFGIVFQRCRTEQNMLALCEDIFDFSNNAMKDYIIYKSLRNYLNQNRSRLKNHKDTFKRIDKAMADVPKQLNFNEAWRKYNSINKNSDNPAFQRITDLYYRTDLNGYKSDERMANMIDDSIHVYYCSHCNYFLTIDDRCYCKAAKIYSELNIPTMVMKPLEFLEKTKFDLI